MNTERLAIHGLRMLMPFLDRIAVRALAAFAGLFALGLIAVLAIVTITLTSDSEIPGWATTTAVGLGILSLLAVANFIVLFAVFTQSRAVALIGDEDGDG
jgi:hypothetical protein